MGTNLPVVSAARGASGAVNTKIKQETFTKMISAGAGLGIGVKDCRVVFVFENEKALDKLIQSGRAAETQADADAEANQKGTGLSGAAMIAPGVWVYQITKNGLAIQLTLQATKYYKDDDLNKE
jgi:lipid-binding SYLF domain-containing protein